MFGGTARMFRWPPLWLSTGLLHFNVGPNSSTSGSMSANFNTEDSSYSQHLTAFQYLVKY